MKPGSVISPLRTAPPGRGCSSSTSTLQPCSASRFAATSPLWPGPDHDRVDVSERIFKSLPSSGAPEPFRRRGSEGSPTRMATNRALHAGPTRGGLGRARRPRRLRLLGRRLQRDPRRRRPAGRQPGSQLPPHGRHSARLRSIDHTQSLEARAPGLLRMRAKARPLGTARVTMPMTPKDGGTRRADDRETRWAHSWLS